MQNKISKQSKLIISGILIVAVVVSVITSAILLNTNIIVNNNKAAVNTPDVKTASNLKHFGYFNVECGRTYNDIPKLKALGNSDIIFIAFPEWSDSDDNSFHACLQSARDANLKVIIGVYWYFWTDVKTPPTQQPNYSVWDGMKSRIKGYEDVIYAFHLDEPYARGIPENQFTSIVNKVRADYPNIAFSSIEAHTKLTDPNLKASYFANVTDLAFDYYGDVDFNTFPDWTIEKTSEKFQQFLRITSPNQKLWLIPQTFTSSAKPNSDRLTKILNEYYLYGLQNPRIVGIMGFLYSTKSASDLGHGVADLSNTSSQFYIGQYASRNISIGKEILSGQPIGVNLAIGSTVTASASFQNNPITYAIDGVPTTTWNSGGGNGSWIELNLKKSYTLGKIRLKVNQWPGGPTIHKIFTGNTPNPQTLTKTLSDTYTSGSWIEVPISVNAQYIRILTQLTPSWAAWDEIEVYEPSPITPSTTIISTSTPIVTTTPVVTSTVPPVSNDAKITNISASASTSYTSYTPNLVLDGNSVTVWNSGISQPSWIELNLNDFYKISKVRLQVAQYPAGNTNHTLTIGNTASPTSNPSTLSGSYTDGSWIEVPVNNIVGKYLKVTTNSTPSWVSWREIEVYGTKTTPPANTSFYLSDLNWKSASVGFSVPTKDLNLNASGDKTIKINNIAYTKGLVAHANSDVRYDLNSIYKRFTAKLGIEDQGVSTNLGSVIFQVWGDGVKLYESPKILGNSPTASIDVNVTGVKELKLITTDGGDGIAYDESVWADAKLFTN